MTRHSLILLAAGGSLALLAAAFLFQALGWAPCAMCVWQRWPHVAAVAFGAIGVVLATPLVALGGALSALATAGLAAYHSGVERDWWEGPAACAGGGGDLSGLTGEALLPGAAAEAPPLVLCDTFTPFLFGLSMANWNLLASLVLAALWLRAATAR